MHLPLPCRVLLLIIQFLILTKALPNIKPSDDHPLPSVRTFLSHARIPQSVFTSFLSPIPFLPYPLSINLLSQLRE